MALRQIAPVEVQARFPPATRNRHDLLRAAYEGEIAVIDAELGKLFAARIHSLVRTTDLVPKRHPIKECRQAGIHLVRKRGSASRGID
ncbi:MAG: hypothetical protein JRG94_22305 [Deltaproteobacteria bacterium]|nr:hypothetical protein [Deltaproteobacteria bacterium]